MKQRSALQAFNSGLPAHLLNIEQKQRSNPFAWRGQFSPQLVEALLKAYAKAHAVVLDPFMGSGTVLVEGARLDHETYGFEVNPAAFTIARVYEFCNRDISTRLKILSEAEEIVAEALPNDLPLFSATSENLPCEFSPLALSLASLDCTDENVRSLLEALLILVDQEENNTNAKWSRWQALKKIVLALPHTSRSISAKWGDARRLLLPNHSVDFVLTSPPYINVFNYHHNYRTAVEALGWAPLEVAKSEIGSNRKFRQNRFLTIAQYCLDMALALHELNRVCKPSAAIILILGRESNVQKTPFYNGVMVSRVAEEVNKLAMVFKQERVFQNRFGQSIYEDILHLEPSPVFSQSEEEVAQAARNLAKEILLEARQRVPNDRRDFLEDALASVAEVSPSPLLNSKRAMMSEQKGVLSV